MTATRKKKPAAKMTAIPPSKPKAISAEALARAMFEPQPTQDYRNRFGRTLSLDRIENALRDADSGRMLSLTDLEYETVNVDPHLAAVLAKRIGAVASLPVDIVPASGIGVDANRAERFAAFVREQIDAIPKLQQSITQLAWGLFHGRAALEIMWRPHDRDIWRVEKLTWVHPRRLSFGPERELRLWDGPDLGFAKRGVALRDYRHKFVEFLPQLFGEYPEREGLGPRCLYWSFFKRFAMRERMILLELFGKPWRIIEVSEESGASADDLEAADEAAQKLGGANTARMPRGTQLKVVSPNRAAGQIHDGVVSEADSQISRLVLGQDGTTSDGGSVPGAPPVLQGEQLVLLRRDAHLVGEALETLADSIVAVNFGEAMLGHAPRVVLRIPQDGRAELERLKAALDAGLSIAAEEAYAISGFRQPHPGEAVVRIEQPPASNDNAQPPAPRPMIVVTTASRRGLTLARQPATANGSPETIVDRGITEGSAMLARWVERYESAVAGAVDASQIQAALARTHDELEVDDLAATLSDRLLHSVMLGALDGQHEFETDEQVGAAGFSASARPVALASSKSSFARLPFSQALKYFQSKKVLPKKLFDQLEEAARARAFTVAGAANDALLELFAGELARQVSHGGELREFRRFVRERAELAGWTPSNPSHVETIYRTNLVDAYGGGRKEHARQPEVLAARPYWQIRTVKDARQRKAHSAVDGWVLRADDKFWDKGYPPFSFNCRCRVTTLSEEQVKKRGLTVRTGDEIRGLPEPGFSR